MQHGGRNWHLSLVYVIDQPVHIAVESDGTTLTFEEIAGGERIETDRGGRQTRTLVDSVYPGEYIGAATSLRDTQVGAISFSGPYQELWLANNLSQKWREVLTGVGYGLLLYSWRSDDRQDQ